MTGMIMKQTPQETGISGADPVRISLKGIEGLGRKSISFLLSMQKTRRYEVVDEHPDAITIIDIDDFRGLEAWNKIKSNPGQSRNPVILLGLEPMEVKQDIALRKPFRPDDILGAIERLLERVSGQAANETIEPEEEAEPSSLATDRRMPDKRKALSSSAASSLNDRELHAFVGSATDVDLDDARALASVQYSPDDFLAWQLNRLMETAVREQKYLRLGCCDAEFYIDPFQKRVHTLTGERSLRSLGALPLGHENLSTRKLSELPEELRTEGQHHSWESFIWRMALASSRGRLPEGTDLDQRFILRRWPNLTRLMLFPHATRISAAWVAGPRSIREILEQLSLPQRHVFAFFSAAMATGYLKAVDSTNQSQDSRTSTPGTNRRRGLFRRLLKTLYRKQGDNQA
ncbi:hypothetical protein [Thiolapillus sp.]